MRLFKIPVLNLTTLLAVLLLATGCPAGGTKPAEVASDVEVISPQQAVREMGIGINLGNTLDAYPNEGDWAPPAQPQYLKAFRQAGFKHVRIPVTWDTHVQESAPFTIDPKFLARVEQVVDWALDQGGYVIVNAHHEHWFSKHYGQGGKRQRFAAIWQQAAERLRHKSPRLLFEIFNEPEGMTAAEVDQLNADILPIIRRTNPTRLVIFSGHGFTPISSLLAAAVPDDPYLIGNFHAYDPWDFAGKCVRGWGSAADIAALTDIYDQAAAWSRQHGVPVTVNEFGAAHYDFTAPANRCDPAARLKYLETHVRLASERGIAATVWDDNGSFGIYRRETNSWGPEKDVLVAPNRR